MTPQLFWLANGLALATFGLTLAIFFAIPRVSAGLYQKGFGENIRTSGFSETVNLGEIGPIKRDPSVVMRVELPGRSRHDGGRLYLRGVAFDQYDGKVLDESAELPTGGERKPGRDVCPSRESIACVIPPWRNHPTQNILLEPLDTAVLFAAPFIERVSGKFPSVQSDLTGSVYLPLPSSSRIEYSVLSRSNPVLTGGSRLGTQPLPRPIYQTFLADPCSIPSGSPP